MEEILHMFISLLIVLSILVLNNYVFVFFSHLVTLQGKDDLKHTIKELTSELKGHDLFIYSGHGNGKIFFTQHIIYLSFPVAPMFIRVTKCVFTRGQYIPWHEI